jgi:hypothetical protein
MLGFGETCKRIRQLSMEFSTAMNEISGANLNTGSLPPPLVRLGHYAQVFAMKSIQEKHYFVATTKL